MHITRPMMLLTLCGLVSACEGVTSSRTLGEEPTYQSTTTSTSMPGIVGTPTTTTGGPVMPGPGPVITPDGKCASPQEQIAPQGVRKLTRVEYVHALERVFPKESMDEVRSILGLVPSDDPEFKDPPSQFAPEITKNYATGTFEVSHKIASYVVRDPKQLQKIGPACLGQNPDTACVQDFVKSFGLKLYGREVSDKEIQSHLELWALDTEDTSNKAERLEVIVASMLNAPEFMWVIQETEGGKLTQLAVAERLSFASWGAAPDRELLEAAKLGKLDSADERQAHAKRLLDTPQGRKHATRLVARWFDIEREIDLNPSARFLSLKVDGLYDDMTKESFDFIEHVIFEQKGNYEDLMTSNMEFPSTQALAKVMGYDKPTSEATASVTGRAGMLTRPALLVHVYDRPSPIHRAAVILFRVLCRENIDIPPDANDVANERLDEIEDPAQFTSRELAQKVTAGSCDGCHSFINPLGFALSGFGAVGQAWEQETVWDTSKQEPTILNELMVDASANLLLDGKTTQITGPTELGQKIATSQEGQACAAKQVFRTTHLREPVKSDTCHIKSLEDAFGSGDSLFDILVMNAANESINTAPQ